MIADSPSTLDPSADTSAGADWKRRALDAEAALAAAQSQVQTLTDRCQTHERNIQSIRAAEAESKAAAERDRLIRDALAPHAPIDPALCATLIERELERVSQDASGDSTTDPAKAINAAAGRLASERPYLFRAVSRISPGATMAGEPAAPGRSPIDDALEEARVSGGRTQILRYLRLRRAT